MRFFVIVICLFPFAGLAQEVISDSTTIDNDSTIYMEAIPLEILDSISYAEEFRVNAVQFQWGVRGGLSKTRMTTSEGGLVRISPNGTPLLINNQIVRDQLVANSSFSTGFSAGLFARLVRGSFYLEPELIYSKKGGKFDILDKSENLINRVKAEFTAIDVPVLLGLRFRDARIFGGPVFSYAFQKNDTFTESLTPYSNNVLSDDIFKRPIINTIVGIGFEFNTFFFDLRYENGINNYMDTSVGPGSNPFNFKYTNSQFLLSVGLFSGRK